MMRPGNFSGENTCNDSQMLLLERFDSSSVSLFIRSGFILYKIGVDKNSKAFDKGGTTFNTHQKEMFSVQFDLASQLERPVSLHCVKAHGWLLQFFRNWRKRNLETYFPRVLWHSYSGSPDIITGLLKTKEKDNYFFSFSDVINNRNNSNRMVENIKAVPDNAIIIESDWDSCAPQPEAMLTIASIISDVKGWTLHKTVTKTTENSERFFYGKTSKSEEK
eukprot:TRINITY_DN4524_c0_g1_i14.p1 TRINITY_DN4524_c0_g1~~TRINITY_DN4524_c0_g1_i14.p1  ORF type:complete len:220 (+),score=44.28 TRINITY_DN4524_c0_g1_i14:480-1139(+)